MLTGVKKLRKATTHLSIERFSSECRKTKAITLANHKADTPMNQSKLEVKTYSLRKARENVYERVLIGSGYIDRVF